jgi:hypothetical protein
MDAKRHNRSKNKHCGNFVVNNALDPASAPVLSDRLRMQTGYLHAGKWIDKIITTAI